jgi:hypothetical protein
VPTSTFNGPESAAQDGASQIKTRAAEIGQKAADAIDDRRDTLATGIESAATALHARAETLPGGEKVARAAHAAAQSLENASDYVRDQDLRGMLTDVRQLVKRNPGAVLLTAVAVGFLLARSFSGSGGQGHVES